MTEDSMARHLRALRKAYLEAMAEWQAREAEHREFSARFMPESPTTPGERIIDPEPMTSAFASEMQHLDESEVASHARYVEARRRYIEDSQNFAR